MRTVLVVDDNELVRAPLRMGLSAAGHTVLEAADGRAVLFRSGDVGDLRARLAELLDLRDDEKLELTDDATVSVLTASNAPSF